MSTCRQMRRRWLGVRAIPLILLLLWAPRSGVSEGVDLNAGHDARPEELVSEPAHSLEPALFSPGVPLMGQRRERSTSEVFNHAWGRAVAGGIPGAVAGAIQVLALMWLRTALNYQYRYGVSMRQAMATLYKQGGISRLYEGVGFAIIQGPAARFVSTATNDGVKALLRGFRSTRGLPLSVVTAVASLAAGTWRLLLLPLDTAKVVLQVEGAEGFRGLVRRVRGGEVSALYQGALATYATAVVGQWPWFLVQNSLEDMLPRPPSLVPQLLRHAFVGFCASAVSDTVSNCARVLKTTKQASASCASLTYTQALHLVLAADGVWGLLGRGLGTRILGNGLQGILFNVLWRGMQDSGMFGGAHGDGSDDAPDDHQPQGGGPHLRPGGSRWAGDVEESTDTPKGDVDRTLGGAPGQSL